MAGAEDDNVFEIPVGRLKKVEKPEVIETAKATDQIADRHGFVSREEPRKRGRAPSPRTGQVHAKVYPSIAEEIGNEARRRGVQQGVLIEEAWELYKSQGLS